MFLNESSQLEDISESNSTTKSPEIPSKQESNQISQIPAEDCNYISIGAINDQTQQDDSYQDYLNNADLDPLEEAEQLKSIEKKKIIKSTSNKVKKSGV